MLKSFGLEPGAEFRAAIEESDKLGKQCLSMIEKMVR